METQEEKTNRVVLSETVAERIPTSSVCILRKVGGIGDLIMSTPIARQLKDNDPSTYVTFAVSFKYLDGCLPKVLKNNPFVDAIIPVSAVDKSRFSRIIDLSAIKKSLVLTPSTR